MMKLSQTIVTVILSIVAASATAIYIAASHPNATTSARESTFENIVKTGTLRCGYQYWDSAVAPFDWTGMGLS